MKISTQDIFLRLIIFFGLSLIFFCGYSQDDIAQWRGPLRNGTYFDTNLKKTWPEAGLPVVLKIEGIGKGYSSAVVHNNL